MCNSINFLQISKLCSPAESKGWFKSIHLLGGERSQSPQSAIE